MTTAGSQAQTAWRKQNVMDGRSGLRLRADWGCVSVLEGGGHICELSVNARSGVNPLWRPPWATIDPFHYTHAKHARTYGAAPDGRLLASIAGHSLSFDHFGLPSPEETAAALTTRGEAPALKWHRQKQAKSPKPYLQHGLTLPEARIRFSRKLTLAPRHPVIYCEEEAVNLSPYDRPISWNEHVTFGPPFLEAGISWFDMPATRAKVCPASYSPRFSLQPDAEFTWPNAPTKERGRMNLRSGTVARKNVLSRTGVQHDSIRYSATPNHRTRPAVRRTNIWLASGKIQGSSSLSGFAGRRTRGFSWCSQGFRWPEKDRCCRVWSARPDPFSCGRQVPMNGAKQESKTHHEFACHRYRFE
jgi:hypothetical protein